MTQTLHVFGGDVALDERGRWTGDPLAARLLQKLRPMPPTGYLPEGTRAVWLALTAEHYGVPLQGAPDPAPPVAPGEVY